MKSLGICTWTLGIENLDALLAKVRALELDCFQYAEPLEAHPAVEVRNMAERLGLEVVMFDPPDLKPGKKYGSASMENALACYRCALSYAAQLGCGMTLHGLSNWTEDCVSDEEAWAFLAEAVRSIAGEAKERNIPVSYEPCNMYELPLVHSADDVEKLLAMCGCDNIEIMLDSFNMNLAEKDPLATLERWAAKMSVYHLSGSNREGIVQSHIDFRAQYNALVKGGFNGACVMEMLISSNPVNTPPRNEREMQRLTEILVESRDLWRSYGQQVSSRSRSAQG